MVLNGLVVHAASPVSRVLQQLKREMMSAQGFGQQICMPKRQKRRGQQSLVGRNVCLEEIDLKMSFTHPSRDVSETGRNAVERIGRAVCH